MYYCISGTVPGGKGRVEGKNSWIAAEKSFIDFTAFFS